MKKLYIICTLFLTLLFCFNDAIAVEKFDVVIYGGSAGGFAAALQVAAMGKTVALIEPTGHVGGNMVEGLGGADIDNHKEFQNSLALGGLALEFYKRLAKVYKREAGFNTMLQNHTKNTNLWRFESHVAEQIINQWLAERRVKVYLNSRIAAGKDAVKKSRNIITNLRCANGSAFTALQFIDASTEGDLLKAAGITTTVGREANATYGETLNGVRALTDHAQFTVKVDPYKVEGDAKSGLIPTIQHEPLGVPGSADSHIQAYCFRVCLTNVKENQTAFTEPKGYNRSQYEIYLRYIKAGGKLYVPKANIPNGKTDLGAWHDLSHNLYGMNTEYPEGDSVTRARILNEHKTFTKGLFYFLANDAEVGTLAPALQKEWQNWAYAKDEFADNENFPRMFYVRDARRMVSDYVITEKVCLNKDSIKIADPVAVSYWPMDTHSVRRIVLKGRAYNEGFVFTGNGCQPFAISFKTLVPKADQCINISTPTCISASHIAYGAVRLEHNFIDLGQACATAAVMAIDQHIPIQQVNYQKLKQQLLQDGQVIDADKVALQSTGK